MCYYEPFGVKRDYKKAFSFYERAYNLPVALSDNLCSDIEYMLALCYYYGKGTEENEELAIELANRAMEKENVEAMCLLGHIYECRDLDEESFKYYLQASKFGCAEAEYNMALAYEFGDDYISKDPEKAFEWYSKAAEKNHPEALCQLANYYWDGNEIEQNKRTALSYYIKAAEKGNLFAMSKLSHIYKYESDVVETNDGETSKWDKVYFETCFEKANEGCEDYYSDLSSCYRHGIGTDENLDESLKWIILAIESEKHSIYLIKNLDEMVYIYNELDTVEKGINLYETIAAGGNQDIQYALAEHYMDGDYFFPKDFKKALYWYGLVSGDRKEDAQARINEINSLNLNVDETEPYTADNVSNTSVDYSYQKIADQLVSEGHQLLEAIKLLREKTGLGLAEAKTYVEIAIKSNPNYQSTPKSGGCYIATCVYGSYDCSQVWTLRRFRDYTLVKTWYGRVFVKTYYLISPQIVKVFGKNRLFKYLCKHILDKMVSKLKFKGFSDDKYSDIEW